MLNRFKKIIGQTIDEKAVQTLKAKAVEKLKEKAVEMLTEKAVSKSVGTSASQPVRTTEPKVVEAKTERKEGYNKITSARIDGRCRGLILILTAEAGIDSNELKNDKEAQKSAYLRIQEKFPKEIKIYNQLIVMEEELKKKEAPLSEGSYKSDLMIGMLEAKTVHITNRPWADLTELRDIV
ncbi:MAG: hypothetical protein LUC88_02505 [Prevotella sp.]|nr:hypothetical protein [Prevotella sp.]